jgi:L,D-peptidoglycan transpeptidase YkuD (ErfK/YbiS/YcfS/YnhG family)
MSIYYASEVKLKEAPSACYYTKKLDLIISEFFGKMTRFKKIFFLILFSALNITCYANLDTSFSCHITPTNQSYPCAVGKAGVHVNKKEGDKATPAGQYSIREFFYRADKLTPGQVKVMRGLQQRGFRVQTLTPDDGWVDDVNSPYYNQFVKISSFKETVPSHENLWREDDIYDIIGVIGYNDNPIIKGKGSAIFLHVARPLPEGGYTPTVGCVALPKEDLVKVLSIMTTKTRIDIPVQGNTINFY